MEPQNGPADVTELELVGGVEPMRIGLVEHRDEWARAFEEHRDRIREALGDAALAVHHIGSTSVPGLAAKPIVDIVVAVADIADDASHLPALIDAGYELRVREPGHRMVRTPGRTVHVHIYPVGDPAIANYLLLRDRLRSNPTDRVLYESVKRELMTRTWTDMNAYADAKTDVIMGILERARAARTLT